MNAQRQALLGLSHEELHETLKGQIDRAFRIDQIEKALHTRRVASFAEMTELSLGLRRSLEASFVVGRPAVKEVARSLDGTTKFLLELSDGRAVEAVDIPEGKRRTFCISSQAGCALACKFCVTGYFGAGRNLTAGEMVGQVDRMLEDRPLKDDETLNLVFMGMGEPLLNLDALRRALEILTRVMSWRRITISTAGVVPSIEAMARWPRRPNLAISLHAADDVLRSGLMPINRKYPLDRLFRVLRSYPLERSRRITFEYTLMRGINDREQDPAALQRLLHGMRAKVNLIPLNPDPVLGDLKPSDPERIESFRAELVKRGVPASVRRPRGDDVSAACGQLRSLTQRRARVAPASLFPPT